MAKGKKCFRRIVPSQERYSCTCDLSSVIRPRAGPGISMGFREAGLLPGLYVCDLRLQLYFFLKL